MNGHVRDGLRLLPKSLYKASIMIQTHPDQCKTQRVDSKDTLYPSSLRRDQNSHTGLKPLIAFAPDFLLTKSLSRFLSEWSDKLRLLR